MWGPHTRQVGCGSPGARQPSPMFQHRGKARAPGTSKQGQARAGAAKGPARPFHHGTGRPGTATCRGSNRSSRKSRLNQRGRSIRQDAPALDDVEWERSHTSRRCAQGEAPGDSTHPQGCRWKTIRSIEGEAVKGRPSRNMETKHAIRDNLDYASFGGCADGSDER